MIHFNSYTTYMCTWK